MNRPRPRRLYPWNATKEWTCSLAYRSTARPSASAGGIGGAHGCKKPCGAGDGRRRTTLRRGEGRAGGEPGAVRVACFGGGGGCCGAGVGGGGWCGGDLWAGVGGGGVCVGVG